MKDMQQNNKKNEFYANFLEGFCERLRKSRKTKQLSMAALAEIVGFSSSSQISRYENGDNFPDPFVLLKISKALDIDLHWLITGEIYWSNNQVKSQLNEFNSKLLDVYEEATVLLKLLKAKQQSGQSLAPEEEMEPGVHEGLFRVVLIEKKDSVEKEAIIKNSNK